MKPVLLIVNPCSGTCQGMRKLGEIVDLFQKADWLTTVMITQKRGDAEKFARDDAAAYELVVCVGGDGTFSETVSGLLRAPRKLPLGYIPAGSRNDLAASLGLPSSIPEAVRALVGGRPRMLDIGRFNERYFAYVASFGAFTKASYNTPQDLKNVLGYLAYVLEGIKDLANLQSVRLKGMADEDVFEGEYIFGAVSNSMSIGGILQFDPASVDLNDGLLELLLIRSPASMLELARIIHALQSRQYRECELFIFRSARKIRLCSETGFDWTLDGELVAGEKEIEIENIPNAYQIIL